MLEKDECLVSVFGIVTQSGSSIAAYGFDGLLGFNMVVYMALSGLGGLMVERAILPFSSHHFWRSELAGGSPGSIAS